MFLCSHCRAIQGASGFWLGLWVAVFHFGRLVFFQLRDGFIARVEVQQSCKSKVEGYCENQCVKSALALMAFCEVVSHRKKSLVVNATEI